MSNQDSDERKPIGRYARLTAATKPSSGDSGITKKDSDNEPKIGSIGGAGSGSGRGQISQMAVCICFVFANIKK